MSIVVIEFARSARKYLATWLFGVGPGFRVGRGDLFSVANLTSRLLGVRLCVAIPTDAVNVERCSTKATGVQNISETIADSSVISSVQIVVAMGFQQRVTSSINVNNAG